jgi:hypothetical protein
MRAMVVGTLKMSCATLQATRLVSSSGAQAISMSASSMPASGFAQHRRLDAVAGHATQVQPVLQWP